jgi:secondary thiamine-phosphate synthase enzyme
MHRTGTAVSIEERADVESVRFLTDSIRLKTDRRSELYNITDSIQDALKRHRVGEGLVIVSSLHTTLALFVNEWQSALLHDIKQMLDTIVAPGNGYRHDDPRYSDCDRRNAHAHLQATLLGHTLALPVRSGELLLGQFQAVIAAELDGPRSRDIALQIVGR